MRVRVQSVHAASEQDDDAARVIVFWSRHCYLKAQSLLFLQFFMLPDVRLFGEHLTMESYQFSYTFVKLCLVVFVIACWLS